MKQTSFYFHFSTPAYDDAAAPHVILYPTTQRRKCHIYVLSHLKHFLKLKILVHE